MSATVPVTYRALQSIAQGTSSLLISAGLLGSRFKRVGQLPTPSRVSLPPSQSTASAAMSASMQTVSASA